MSDVSILLVAKQSDREWLGKSLPYALARQHLRCAAAAEPHGEEDHEQRGREHHLPRVGGRVPDGQGERHGAPQPWRAKWGRTEATTRKIKVDRSEGLESLHRSRTQVDGFRRGARERD